MSLHRNVRGHSVCLDTVLCGSSYGGLFPRPSQWILRNYSAVALECASRHQVPLVHGRSMTWYVFDALRQHLGAYGLQRLRSFDPELYAQSARVWAQVEQELDAQQQRAQATVFKKAWLYGAHLASHGRSKFDHQQERATSLLACTVGAAHSDRMESPLTFVFGAVNPKLPADRGNTSIYAGGSVQLALNTQLKALGYTPERVEKYMRKVTPLITEAMDLPYGDLLVVGMPRSYLHQRNIAYPCRPFGHPEHYTLNDVVTMIEDRAFREHRRSCQLRLVLGQPLMDAHRQFSVVSVLDESQAGPALQRQQGPALEALTQKLVQYTGADNCPQDNEACEKTQSFMRRTNEAIQL